MIALHLHLLFLLATFLPGGFFYGLVNTHLGGFVPSPSFMSTDVFIFGLKLSFCYTDHSVGFVNYVQWQQLQWMLLIVLCLEGIEAQCENGFSVQAGSKNLLISAKSRKITFIFYCHVKILYHFISKMFHFYSMILLHRSHNLYKNIIFGISAMNIIPLWESEM